MLRAVSEILGSRLLLDGDVRGRIRDVYFDTRQWTVQFFIAAWGTQHQVDDLRLISAAQDIRFCPLNRTLHLPARASLANFPSASSARPVCKQYESFCFGSPASRPGLSGANPHLRSWNTVRTYGVEHQVEPVGLLSEMLLDPRDWSIRYLRLSQSFDGKALQSHILPLAIDAISFARQRVTLRTFEPVHLNHPALEQDLQTVTAA